MTNDEKKKISEELRKYVAGYPSQNKAAASLDGVSAATVSALLQGKWEKVSDEMWRRVESQTGLRRADEWLTVATRSAREMDYAMRDAQEWTNVTWVVGDAGCGKTTAARRYAREHREAFYVLCSEDMHRSDFLREVARCVGMRTDGMTIRETMDGVIDQLVRMDRPVLLFDEADKLSDRVFHYFIELYNRMEDRCGMVFFSTSYIKRRMLTGLRYDKKGYNEIHSRIGRKFYELEPTAAEDVVAVCTANGVRDRRQVAEVVKDAERYDFDLRRVKKAVHRVKRMAAAGADVEPSREEAR